MICPNCGNLYLTALADCVECGACAICFPWECTCVYWEDEEGEYQEPEDWDDEPEEEFGEDNYLWFTQFWQS